MFLEESKYVKEKNMSKNITSNVEISSDEEDPDEESSYNGNSNEENYGEEYWKSNFGNVVFEGAIFRMYSLREQF